MSKPEYIDPKYYEVREETNAAIEAAKQTLEKCKQLLQSLSDWKREHEVKE